MSDQKKEEKTEVYSYHGYTSTLRALSVIPQQPGRREIFYDELEASSMRHLTDGSNSNIFKCKFGKEKVIIKIVQRNPPDPQYAWKEFSVEHESLMRIR